ncbi:biliverdin-producing heme oxygenase [Hymenobacter sp. H14-R3]|uniref:biliverdin-producing heme oxygenase n=1 Tax=Hymenobacter sp. H14-R3 TaxID=3046308 RepID=UPI0024BAF41E|nr:biliverdin-producing heme oxygenase [Hymenobacter sp. H14-R3]MDJ0364067.1 biliverdin-producing heme oxygenase [Hymenobacter sp. H14-R3]
MSIAPVSSGLLARLRAETRPYHDAVEQNEFNRALGAGTPGAAATTRFLADMYGFMRPYETQLLAHAPALGPAWEIPGRLRAHLILEDLRVPAHQLPLCPALPPLATRPQLLGAMYVLEGSTLGGQVLARQLAKAGLDLGRFFTGAGPLTGPRWKSFCHLLAATATPGQEEAEVVQSAIVTFQTLAAWLARP